VAQLKSPPKNPPRVSNTALTLRWWSLLCVEPGRGLAAAHREPSAQSLFTKLGVSGADLKGPHSGKDTVNYDVVIHCELSPPTDAYGTALTVQGSLLYI